MTDTVLIVDGSLTVRMDLQEAFEDGGFRALLCPTAASARETLAGTTADVVVLDILLPDGDGVDLLSVVRASRSSDAIVLMFSTEPEVTARLHGLCMGANEYVRKPYDRYSIVAKSRELLQTRRAGVKGGSSPILIVDDSVACRRALSHALEQAGHRVRTADSAEEGLRVAAAERPVAIMVASVLPGLDGATMIRRLRFDAALHDVPCLLLMTGSDDRDAELSALEAGADAFVRKDDTTELVVARLAAVLRNAQTSISDEPGSAHGPKRILVVDDSATYLAEVAAMLRDESYEVVPARSGEEALELLAERSIDCILLDLMMPGLSGRETCQRIKAAPMMRDIPLIMLTALEDRATMLDAMAAGADDYVPKSSDLEVLQTRVRAQLRRKQFEDDNRCIRAKLHNMELEASEARAARALADSRAELLGILDQKNRALEAANAELRRESERRYRELQTQLAHSNRVASIGQIAASIAHEVNQPIGAMMTNAQASLRWLSVEPPRVEEVRQGLLRIINDGNRAEDVIGRIRELLKKAPPRRESVDVNKAIREVIELTVAEATKTNISVQTQLAAHLPLIDVDRVELQQVLLNLVINAMEALSGINDGVRSVLISTAQADAGDVLVAVSDSGPGFSPQSAERVFVPFYTTKPAGLGMGLSICRSIVEAHGGRLWASANSPRGAIFQFTVPVHPGGLSA
jgi:two-component system, NtrC family, sensor kinase